jgi:hypothetical protein
MHRILIALLFLIGAAQANVTPQPGKPELGTPQEFSARVRAGSASFETFDFAAAGFWNLPDRWAWMGGLKLSDSWGQVDYDPMAECHSAWSRLTLDTAWMHVLIGSRNAQVWAGNMAALRTQLHALDLATWDAVAATGVTPASSRAEHLRRRYVWIQTLNDSALDARLQAGLPRAARRYWSGLKRTRILQVECANMDWLRAQTREIGWFDIPRFGAAADARAWTLLDRALRDPSIDDRVLHSLEAMPAGSTVPSHFAYLYDRVAVIHDRPQRYGTAGSCYWRGDWYLANLEDPQNVDARRATVGLGPLAEFVSQSKADCHRIARP